MIAQEMQIRTAESFFDICPSSWGNGLNADEFRWLVEMGYTDGELAGHLTVILERFGIRNINWD
ncbi:hypothetical protein [Halocatena marina]|uniref:hypothetical protein n=1 Tax=Halocatena marina TaxID=2934937 RepID=UPI00222FCD55|nr:hypothetical protein [Halocatena marina]